MEKPLTYQIVHLPLMYLNYLQVLALYDCDSPASSLSQLFSSTNFSGHH
jgi:hypothetical protein